MSTPPRPSLVPHWLALAEELVGRAAPQLDALNLFPVPDADTGTNMLATLTAARTAADACPAQDDAGAVLAHAGAAALD
ncbi:DAK2 domain-containing protein, partial [Micrococcus luteus]|nr:DAK2 domain-containing protein [Micrococcus luteus]